MDVRSTRIFARPLAGGRQALMYDMSVELSTDVAMVLPLPVPPRTPDGEVHFVDLSEATDIFDSLNGCFVGPQPRSKSIAPSAAPLPVVQVGDFVASFVPSMDDFGRLDPQFRLSRQILGALDVDGWGFAVFQLKAPPPPPARSFWAGLTSPKARPASIRPHPMAFTFPRVDPTRLFFPTVHVHDGRVAEYAAFDHMLYAQGATCQAPAPMLWTRGQTDVTFVPEQALEIVAEGAPIWRREIKGRHPNRDVWINGD